MLCLKIPFTSFTMGVAQKKRRGWYNISVYMARFGPRNDPNHVCVLFINHCVMAQPTQVVGCCWNRLDEPAFVAVLFLGWQEITILKKTYVLSIAICSTIDSVRLSVTKSVIKSLHYKINFDVISTLTILHNYNYSNFNIQKPTLKWMDSSWEGIVDVCRWVWI